MRCEGSIVLLFMAVLFLTNLPLRIGSADANQFQLSIEPSVGGNTVPPPGTYLYNYGSTVTVSANPDSGYVFDYWVGENGNLMGDANPIVVTIYSNMTLQPNFENASSAKRTLTILVGSNGTTNPMPGNYSYAYGDNVTVTAIPDSGFLFTQWQDPWGNYMGSQNPDLITMNRNCTIQPVFENSTTAQRTLTIASAAGGTTDPPPGNYTYPYGTNVTVTAIPDIGFIFDTWMNGPWPMGNQNPNILMMVQNFSLQPVFENASTAQRTLTIDAAQGGTTDPPPGNYTYAYGQNVSIKAIPDTGYIFTQWIDPWGHFQGFQNPDVQIMNWNYTIQPVFENASTAQRTLTIIADSGGTTNPLPGVYTFAYGAIVTVTAVPDSGFNFEMWTNSFGPMGNQNPDMLMMVQNFSLEAVFENTSTAQRTLTINVAQGGTTDPSAGNYTYPYMTNAIVTAIPDSGYEFDHWVMGSGNYFGDQNPLNLTMNWNFTIQAIFENTTSGTRTLIIWSNSNGTTDPPPGTYTYDYGENVTVTAIPQNGTYFGGWMMDQASGGMSNPITVTMDRSHTLGPNFVPNPPTSTVQVTISPATGGTTDPAPGTYTYLPGNQAEVTAIPDPGWWLDYWLLDGNNFGNSTTIEFNLDGNHMVRPVFASNSHPSSFMLTMNEASEGTTNPAAGTYTYEYGTNVTISATPKNGQSFEHWLFDGQIENSNPITLQMTQDHTLQPVFTNGQGGSGQGSQNFSLNVPPIYILVPSLVIIACCFVGYLVPLELAIRKGKVPPSVKKPRLILALVSILIIAGPLGATLLIYQGNLSGVLTPSNVNKLNSMLSSQGGIGMPNVTSSWCNLTARTFSLLFNFTNPTATDLTLIGLSANVTDHSDSYPLGPIALASPVTAGSNETVTFEMTSMLTEEAVAHLETTYAGASSFDADLSSVNLNYAGIMLQMNGTSTIDNVSILR
ncbi:MAG TPA: hypothetical protein VEH86_05965 [Candidatus Acidoferrum sp.]|nr:hypothetical protein [Candidatus Acidoferrum sp.]